MNTTSAHLKGQMRTHTCGELTAQDIGKTVTLCGWVNKSRDLGGLHFKDIRDKFGLTQLNFSEYAADPEVSLESTIWVRGEVRSRPPEACNRQMATGEVEVLVQEFKVLSRSDKDHLPFLPEGKVSASEDTKLRYRYLDLRSKRLQEILSRRSQTAQQARAFLTGHGFCEVETPILYKSTPEGARDYIVPSRVHPGHVYALPQSPQTLKQLLMIGGTDRYFQIVKCFRDEDLRADRQPEFTQIDIEASFVDEVFIYQLASRLVATFFDLPADFLLPQMSYEEAMSKYGSDKPDLRFGLVHHIVTDLFKESEFKLFRSVAQGGGMIKAIFVPEDQASLTRKMVEGLVPLVKPYGGEGVAWFKCSPGEKPSGGIAKFITDSLSEKLQLLAAKEAGTWLFFAHQKASVVHHSADAVRRHLGREFGLYTQDFAFAWIHRFPLFEYSEEDQRLYACHHPFTQPATEDLETFLKGDLPQVKNLRANAYDVVCNGYELAGGSVRIFDQQVQNRMFELLGMSQEEKEAQFGFFLEALRYGVPPHAGIAFGFDRLVMMLSRTEHIRDVIAFPKTATASDLMAASPSRPQSAQLQELHMKFLDE